MITIWTMLRTVPGTFGKTRDDTFIFPNDASQTMTTSPTPRDLLAALLLLPLPAALEHHVGPVPAGGVCIVSVVRRGVRRVLLRLHGRAAGEHLAPIQHRCTIKVLRSLYCHARRLGTRAVQRCRGRQCCGEVSFQYLLFGV